MRRVLLKIPKSQTLQVWDRTLELRLRFTFVVMNYNGLKLSHLLSFKSQLS